MKRTCLVKEPREQGDYLLSGYLILHLSVICLFFFFSNLLTADSFEQSCQVDWVSQMALMLKKPICQRRRHKRHEFHPWVGKISWRRAWQSTCLENPMDRGVWQAKVSGAAKSWTQLSNLSHTHVEWIETISQCYRICGTEFIFSVPGSFLDSSTSRRSFSGISSLANLLWFPSDRNKNKGFLLCERRILPCW